MIVGAFYKDSSRDLILLQSTSTFQDVIYYRIIHGTTHAFVMQV
jgi:hypothetical protein